MKVINQIKCSLTLMLFLLFSIGCMVVKTPSESNLQLIGHEKICEGNLYGAGEEGLEAQTIIIQSQQELETLLDKMSSINPTSCSDILMTIDFSEYDLIFLLDQVRGSAGYAIEVSNISELNDLVTIQYEQISPQGMAATVMTQPFCFEQVLKLNSEVQFELSE